MWKLSQLFIYRLILCSCIFYHSFKKKFLFNFIFKNFCRKNGKAGIIVLYQVFNYLKKKKEKNKKKLNLLKNTFTHMYLCLHASIYNSMHVWICKTLQVWFPWNFFISIQLNKTILNSLYTTFPVILFFLFHFCPSLTFFHLQLFWRLFNHSSTIILLIYLTKKKEKKEEADY